MNHQISSGCSRLDISELVEGSVLYTSISQGGFREIDIALCQLLHGQSGALVQDPTVHVYFIFFVFAGRVASIYCLKKLDCSLPLQAFNLSGLPIWLTIMRTKRFNFLSRFINKTRGR